MATRVRDAHVAPDRVVKDRDPSGRRDPPLGTMHRSSQEHCKREDFLACALEDYSWLYFKVVALAHTSVRLTGVPV